MNLFEQSDELGTKIREDREAKKRAEDAASKAKDDAVAKVKKRESG